MRIYLTQTFILALFFVIFSISNGVATPVNNVGNNDPWRELWAKAVGSQKESRYFELFQLFIHS